MIHSIEMFNLLAQIKLRSKIKTALVYDYIISPLLFLNVCFLPLPFLRFIYFDFFKKPVYGFLNSTVLNSLISTFFHFPSLFYFLWLFIF